MTTSAKTPTARLASLDALRGFDMLMISGGGSLLYLLGGKTGIGFIDAVAAQFHHPDWNGFTFYDFIMPLFLFMAGTGLSFSLAGGLAKGIPKAELAKKVFKRMIILILLGILDKNAPVDIFDPGHIRYGTVLGRIGLATFIASLLYMNFSWKQRLFWALGILVAYFAALILIPVPGFGAGDLSFEGNLVGWVDRNFMPGRLKQGTYDELALLTQFPALCLTVFGSLAGDVLQRNVVWGAKLKTLIIMGAIGVVVGITWGFVFPINKHLWSSSFICLTAGMAFLSLALFYWIIDIKGFQSWAFPLRVIGLNSLVIYLACRFIDFRHTSQELFSGLYGHLDEKWHEFFQAFGGLVLVWLVLYILYRHRIFVKV